MAFGTIDFSNCGGCNSNVNLDKNVIDYGEETVANEIQRALVANNEIVRDILSKNCMFTTAQKLKYADYEIGLPLERSHYHVGWTEEWLKTHSVARLVQIFSTLMIKDVKGIRNSLREAIYNPVNNLEYKDMLTTGDDLPLFSILNGDGRSIPTTVDGTTFVPFNHTHYSVSPNWTIEIVRNVIRNVTEHGTSGVLQIWINKKNEKDIWALEGFSQLPDPEPNQPFYTISPAFNYNTPLNRMVGYVDNVEVWIKPVAYEDTLVVIDTGIDEVKNESGDVLVEAVKPFACRYLDELGEGLRLGISNEHFPLRAHDLHRTTGIGIANRHMIAVHQFTNNSYYTKPTEEN